MIKNLYLYCDSEGSTNIPFTAFYYCYAGIPTSRDETDEGVRYSYILVQAHRLHFFYGVQ